MRSDFRGHHYWGNLRLSGDLVGLVRNVRARELENSLETLRRVRYLSPHLPPTRTGGAQVRSLMRSRVVSIGFEP